MTAPGDVVLAAVKAALGETTVYDAHVPSSTPATPLPRRYAVVYPSTPVPTWDDVGHTSDLFRLAWQVTSVGATRPEAEWIASHVRDALVDVCLVIPGLVCEPVELTESQPIRWDDDIPGRVVLYGIDQYGCNATVDTAA